MQHVVVLSLIVGFLSCGSEAESAGHKTADAESLSVLRAYHSGNGLLSRGMYELAVEEYRSFLTEHGQHDKSDLARYGLAVALFRLGRYEQAAGELTTIGDDEEFEYAAEVGAVLGQCKLALREYGPAVKSFRKVVKNHSKHDLADDAAAGWVEALYLDGEHEKAGKRGAAFVDRRPDSEFRGRVDFFRGLAEMSQGNHRVAVEILDGVASRQPQGPFAERVTLLLAECHHRLGALDMATRFYRDVLSRNADERTPDALLGLAGILRQRGSNKEAGRLLDRLLKEHSGGPLQASGKLQRALVWFDEGRFERALPLFEQVSQEDPDLQDRAAYWSAKCKLSEGNYAEAAERFRVAIDEHSHSSLLPEMEYDRAAALIRAGRLAPAAEALEGFLSRFDDHALAAEARYLLAVTEHRRERYKKSRAHCQAFVDRYPSHVRLSEIAFIVAENEFLLGKLEDAESAYRRFLADHSGSSQVAKAKHRLGTALYRLGKLDEAEVFLADAADELGTAGLFRGTLLTLGDICFERGEWEKSEKYLSDYLSSDSTSVESSGKVPSQDDALLKLGLARQRQGKYSEALSTYDRLLQCCPQSPHRAQALFERGQAHLAGEKYVEASAAFEQVLSEWGGSRFAQYAHKHLGAIALHQADYSSAVRHLQVAQESAKNAGNEAEILFSRGLALVGAEHYADAEEVFDAFLRQHKNHELAGDVRAHRVVALARQDRWADALSAVKDISRRDFTRLKPLLQGTILYEKSWCLGKLDRGDEAADSYRELLRRAEQTPGYRDDLRAQATLELARLEAGAKRYEPCAELLRELISKISAGSAVLPNGIREQSTYTLAVCEFELGRSSEAAALFEEFLDAHADSDLTASASFFCGESFFRQERYNSSVRHFERVADEFATDAAYPASLLRLGEAHASLQRWAKSEEAYTRYLDRFSREESAFRARFGIGWARENQRRFHEAVAAYQEVVDHHQGPTAARAQFQIGECLFAQEKYKDAVRELLKVDIHYAYPEWSAAALYEAGRCFERLANPVEAREQFRTVARDYTGTRWASLANKRLKIVASGGLPGR